MARYIVRRLIIMAPVLLLLSIVIFVLVRIVPNDPIWAMVGEGSDMLTADRQAALRHELGLDRSLPVQYFNWVKGLAIGDWGNSFRTKRPVVQELATRLPYTLQLAAIAFIVSVVIGVSAGVIAALKRNSLADMMATGVAMFGVAVPEFWLALMMILLFGVVLGWLPVFGGKLIWDEPVAGLKHLILPVVALGLGGAATLMRQTRSAMLEVMGEDYIRTARAKGLAERRVVWLHALKNSLLPVVTILGIRLGHIIGGAVIIETMFSWPGVGRLAVTALKASDYPVVQVVVVMSAIVILVANLLTDIAYAYLDPRIRYN
ncbi:MAG: ABC transporter permease [Chloroflexota bacterium]|nr:ABC transporter permease [Chloroflexota bacterium]